MQGHVIVCSFGRMGRMVCRELAAKPMAFVVVERDEAEVAPRRGRTLRRRAG